MAEVRQHKAMSECAALLSHAAPLSLWHEQLLYKSMHTGGDAASLKWDTDR